MMNSNRSRRAEDIFCKAVECPPDERRALLDRACAGDRTLRDEVESLLAADDSADAFLEAPASATGLTFLRCESLGMRETVEAGQRFGAYTVVRLIASGGMGSVYEAVQDQPRRTVALKLLKASIASPFTLRRFQYESELLGRLSHPGIAQIFEAGMADGGDGQRPFFVMELVAGRPLTEYAASQSLSTRQRLELVAMVCDAVQHAHQKGIIHRDLKPANILVADEPAPAASKALGRPKVLDFGVARLTDSDLQMTTLRTGVGQLIGTIPYMSPEQVAGDSHSLDTRSDVYALGVVLYELMTDRLPYDLANTSFLQAAQLIRESPPRRPSSLNSSLRGDIETIALKALEKERDRRYQSAAELGQDIRRFLAGEPPLAQPPTAWRQLRRIMVRNKLAVSFLITLFAIVTGFGVWMSFLYSQADELRVAAESERTLARSAEQIAIQKAQEARTAAQKAEHSNEFLRDILSSGNEDVEGDNLTVRQVLDRTADKLETELAGQPELEADARQTLGRAYESLGRFDEAEMHLRISVEICRRLPDEAQAGLIRGLTYLSNVLCEKARFAEGEELAREALQLARGDFGDRRAIAKAQNALGAILTGLGKLRAAERAYRESLEIHRTEGVTGAHLADAVDNLAKVLLRTGALAEAEQLITEGLGIRRSLKPANAGLADSLTSLAYLMREKGDHEKAEPLLREALEFNTARLGDDHPHVAINLSNLATLLEEKGEFAAAEPFARRALAILELKYGEEHPITATGVNNLAMLAWRQGHHREAEMGFRRSLDLRRKVLPEDHTDIASSLNNLASALRSQGDLAAAEPLYREALAIYRKAGGNRHPVTGMVILNLSRLIFARGLVAEPEQLGREALDIFRAFPGGAHPRLADGLVHLAQVLEAMEDYESAEALGREALTIRSDARPLDPADVSEAQLVLGRCLLRLERFSEAEPLLIEAYRNLRSSESASDTRCDDAVQAIVQLYESWNKPEQAAEWERVGQ